MNSFHDYLNFVHPLGLHSLRKKLTSRSVWKKNRDSKFTFEGCRVRCSVGDIGECSHRHERYLNASDSSNGKS